MPLPSCQPVRSFETTHAIVIAADRLFTERGFDKVTMHEIAKELEGFRHALHRELMDDET